MLYSVVFGSYSIVILLILAFQFHDYWDLSIHYLFKDIGAFIVYTNHFHILPPKVILAVNITVKM